MAAHRPRAAPFFVAVALALAACGGERRTSPATGTGGSAVTRVAPTTMPAGSSAVPIGPGPPPIEVRTDRTLLSLRAWSYCWHAGGTGTCADGRPPTEPPDVGSPDEVAVGFPVPGWTFTATAQHHGTACGRAQTVKLQATGPTTFRLPPIGASGDADVRLFGRGPEGDVATSFRWHTRQDGPTEAPTATASILAGTADQIRSYGVELSMEDLRETPPPGRASAGVVVTSADGHALSVDLERRIVSDCVPEGSALFVAAEEIGLRASRLGAAPFRYDVTLVIDSTTYRGTAIWPDDMDAACSPCTRLHFTPPLPGV